MEKNYHHAVVMCQQRLLNPVLVGDGANFPENQRFSLALEPMAKLEPWNHLRHRSIQRELDPLMLKVPLQDSRTEGQIISETEGKICHGTARPSLMYSSSAAGIAPSLIE